MDLLHSTLSATLQSMDSKTHFAFDPLSASSGNAQSFGGSSHEGVENQRPLPELNVGLSMTQELHFPSPLIKLGSNDIPNLGFDRKTKRHPLKPHRSKPLTNADRPYLTHPKYLEYRSRPRQDIGPDGKPIWPDRIEAAFQNGERGLFACNVRRLTIFSPGTHQTDGTKKMLPAWKTLWAKYAHCGVDISGNR